jgi:hypothetical protein
VHRPARLRSLYILALQEHLTVNLR